jgi:hypothetical protein
MINVDEGGERGGWIPSIVFLYVFKFLIFSYLTYHPNNKKKVPNAYSGTSEFFTIFF